MEKTDLNIQGYMEEISFKIVFKHKIKKTVFLLLCKVIFHFIS
jgi:hypothetical protein